MKQLKINIDTVGKFFAGLLLAFAIIFFLLVFFYWLYGVIAVAEFGLPALSFWKFLGLKVLISWFLMPLFDSGLIKFKTEGE